MAFVHGVNTSFQVTDSGAVNRDISAFVDGVDGLPGVGAVNEVTTFGVAGQAKVFIRGLNDFPFTIKGWFDPTATTGPDAVLSGLRTATTASTFIYGPQGTTAGFVKYTGSCFLTDYKLSSPVANAVSYQASFQSTGPLTRTTF